jgi:uncharacterized integral membrane protein
VIPGRRAIAVERAAGTESGAPWTRIPEKEPVMQIRTFLLLAVFILLAAFAVLNWSAFMAPASLSLVFATVQAPLGIIMLGVVALLSALFLAYVVYLQGAVLLETRRHARELQAQRELADKAEASRVSELRAQLDAGLRALAAQSDERHATTLARLDRIDHDFGAALERTESAMAAYIGELDDRLKRGAPPQG